MFNIVMRRVQKCIPAVCLVIVLGLWNRHACGQAPVILEPTCTVTSLFSFNGTNGAIPQGILATDGNGNFYGTTLDGGSSNKGTIFCVTSSGSLTTLHSFQGVDGANPYGALITGTDGNFYGTTFAGGKNNYGTVFQITPDGSLTTLYSFTYGSDGENPGAPLVQGPDGSFYGVTQDGGNIDTGVVFKINSSGSFSALCSLTVDVAFVGEWATAGLVVGNDGNLYGTTAGGGLNDTSSYAGGTIYQVTASGSLTTIYKFTGLEDGGQPMATMALLDDGSFLGTTTQGGSGNGTIFNVTPSGSLTTLFAFSGTDGAVPESSLVMGNDGNYYGTTIFGGTSGDGTIYRLKPPAPITMAIETGTMGMAFSYQIRATYAPTNFAAVGLPDGLSVNPESGLISGTATTTGTFNATISAINASGTGSATLELTVLPPPPPVITNFLTLHSFSGGNEGTAPYGALVAGNDGYLYGTTTTGGPPDYNVPQGYGTVFKISPRGALTTLCVLTGTGGVNPGAVPYANLAQGNDGNFYGTTFMGGADNVGTAFQVTPSGSFTSLYAFTAGNDGGYPWAGLVSGSNGNLYGVTEIAGSANYGTLFELNFSGSFTLLNNVTFANPVPVIGYGNYSPWFPQGGLLEGKDGNIYGTTYLGSSFPVNYLIGEPTGTAFQLTPSGSLNMVWTFYGGNSGAYPSGALVEGDDGNFYGTTNGGGTGNGMIFRMTSEGAVTMLYSFSGPDGSNPFAGLTQGSDGNYYGTTTAGGNTNNGTIFRISPGGVFSVLYSFVATDGTSHAAMLQGSNGDFYGTTSNGGSKGEGSVFEFAPCSTTSGTVDSFHYQILATNNPTSYGASGLPDGITLDATSGLMSGIPTETGTFIVPVSASNISGTGCGSVTIVVLPGPVITGTSSVTATNGVAFSYPITADGNPTTYTAAGLPPGLSTDPGTGLISGTPTQTGTFNANVAVSNLSGTAGGALTIIVQTPYQTWQNQMFTASQLLDPSICGDAATPSGDGIPNLIKYALNLNPMTVATSGLPFPGTATDTSNDNHLTLSYTQPISATDIIYTVEVSSDLQLWNSGSNSTQVLSLVNNPDGLTQTVVVEDLTPMSSASERFMRLKVTKP